MARFETVAVTDMPAFVDDITACAESVDAQTAARSNGGGHSRERADCA